MKGTHPTVPNRVFIGCPWKNIKRHYESSIDRLAKHYPLEFVLIGREAHQKAEDLLSKITGKLLTSSHAIFDATYGNPNVSLEFGIATSAEIPRSLFLNVSEKHKPKGTDSPIISDLAGNTQNRYRSAKKLFETLHAFCKEHSYSKRFDKCVKGIGKGKRKKFRPIAVRVIHYVGKGDSVLRDHLIEDISSEGKYKKSELEVTLATLHKAELIQVGRGSRMVKIR